MNTPLAEERRLLIELGRRAPRLASKDFHPGAFRWDHVAATAADHRVGPLVYRTLAPLVASGQGDGPVRALAERCRALYVHNLARNAYLYRELGGVLEGLHQAGVPVVVLKGAAMAPSLYGDIALRYMGDLDLLVPKETRARAMELLEERGYRLHPIVPADLRARARRAGLLPRSRGPVNVQTTAKIYARFHFHYQLWREGQFFPLELHWHIAKPGTGVNIAELWQEAQATTIAGVETLSLRPEHLLLHLCLHLTGDAYGQLRLARLVDIDLAVTRQRLDWAHLGGAAERYGIARRVRVALGLTQRVLGTAIPPQALAGGGMCERALIDLVSRRWLADLGSCAPDQASAFHALLWHLASEERWVGVGRALYRTAVHYPEDNRFLPKRYPESELLNFLYSFHPARWWGMRAKDRRAAVR